MEKQDMQLIIEMMAKAEANRKTDKEERKKEKKGRKRRKKWRPRGRKTKKISWQN
jgi:hypothetical protein